MKQKELLSFNSPDYDSIVSRLATKRMSWDELNLKYRCSQDTKSFLRLHVINYQTDFGLKIQL
jgi:hypothetical protein